MMLPAVDTTIPDISHWLQGLPDRIGVPDAPSTDVITEAIRDYVVVYRTAEAVRTAWLGTSGEIGSLDDMAETLKLAQRKIQIMPISLRVNYWINEQIAGGRPDNAQQNALQALDSILNEIAEMRQYLTSRRPRPGGQGAPAHRDMVIAAVSTLLSNVGALNHHVRAHAILSGCGIEVPEDRGAFRDAAKRGEEYLGGAPSNITLDVLRDAMLLHLGLRIP